MSLSATASAVRLREARFDDYAAIAALESGGGLKSRADGDWQRLWTGNPVYREMRDKWPIGWVIETGEGRIAGALSNIPLRYELRGRSLLVAAGRGWTVAEDYRSYALMLMDQYFDQPNVDVFLNTTVNAQAAQAFSVFGSRPVPAGNWSESAFLVTGYRGFAESALRIKGAPAAKALSYPAGLGLWAKEKLQAPRRAVSREPSPAIELAAGFDERFDEFWTRLRGASLTLTGVRDRQTLEWHFGSGFHADGEGAWLLTAPEAGALEAYAIFQRKDEPRYGLKRMRLVDFQALSNPQRYGDAILQRVLRECSVRGIHSLEQVGTGLESTQWFESRAPYRRRLPHWASYYFAPDPALAAELVHPEAWSPSNFDGDASL